MNDIFLNVLRVGIMMTKLTKGIPSLAKSCRGPIPESNNSFGDPTTPALSKVRITKKSMMLPICKMMINRIRMMCLW